MEAFRKKNVLLTRGRFQPFTSLHNDMLAGAAQQFFCEPATETHDPDECVYREDTMVLLEMTTRDMLEVCLGLVRSRLFHALLAAADDDCRVSMGCLCSSSGLLRLHWLCRACFGQP